MRGLDPRIHHLRKTLSKRMDCRVKPGNDENLSRVLSTHRLRLWRGRHLSRVRKKIFADYQP
jgi:hypothetical protein